MERSSPIQRKGIQAVWSALEGYLYLLPTLIILGVFVFYPIISSFNLSLTRVAPFGNQTRFVGIENYQRLFTEILEGGDYWNSLKVTFWFTIWTVPTGIILAVGLAIALSYPLKRLSWFHRLLIFIPIVISSAVTGVIFRFLYNPAVGYINHCRGIGFNSMRFGPGDQSLVALKRTGAGASRCAPLPDRPRR